MLLLLVSSSLSVADSVTVLSAAAGQQLLLLVQHDAFASVFDSIFPVVETPVLKFQQNTVEQMVLK